MTIIYIVCGVLITIGLYNIALDFFKVPYYKISKATVRTIGKTAGDSKFSVIKNDIINFIAKNIRMDKYKHQLLEQKLLTANIAKSPKQYKAEQVFGFIVGLIFAIIGLIVFPLIGIIILVLNVLIYISSNSNIDKAIKEKKESIEKELGLFVYQTSKKAERNKDVLKLLENYTQYAGQAFKRELEITIAEIKSGNEIVALTRLESRINSNALSDVIKGLISMSQGNDTLLYWQSLSVKFDEMTRQYLEREALKIPPKVTKCTMFVCGAFIFSILIILITFMMQSMGGLSV